MFRWVEMSLETLKRIKYQPDFEEALGRLPSKLSGLYDIIHSQINESETHARDVAIKILKWLLCSQRLLAAEELTAAVCIIDSGSSSDSDEDGESQTLPSSEENVILRLCRNLVVFDSGRQVFQFAHQSVREYLLQKPEYTLLEQHALAAERCLDVYRTESSSGDALKRMVQANNVLKAYAEIYWPVHYKYVDDDDYQRLKEKMSRFTGRLSQARKPYMEWISGLQSNPKYSPALSPNATDGWIMNYELWQNRGSRLGYRIFSAALAPETCLYVACAFGLSSLLKDCIPSRNPDGSGSLEVVYDKCLCIAVAEVHDKVVQLLLDHGADVNAKNERWATALHCASKWVDKDVAQLLLDHDANVNVENERLSTALHRVSDYDRKNVIQLLLNHDANVNVENER